MGRGEDDFHSPDVQVSAMRRVTAGMHEVAVVEDIDVTGRHLAREGIDKIRAMVEAGQIDALAVYDVSRIGRNVRESLAFLSWLADQGVTILSACEQVDTSTPAGRLMLTNMLAIAEYRSDEIGRGWSAAIARRAELGLHHGRPLGYRREGRRMVPDPVMGPAISGAFVRYAAGDPVADIARAISVAKGGPVHTQHIKKILRNPVYLGVVVIGGRQYPGQHEPLVDAETWRRVQDRLAADTSTPPRHLAPTWSLVGLCECPAGHKLQRQPHRARSGERQDRLVCGMGRGGVVGGCPGVGRPLLSLVEAEVLAQVAEYGQRLRDDHGARAVRLARMTADRADRAAIESELSRIRRAMTRAAKGWALGDLPDEVYRDTMAELREAEAAAAAELARVGSVEVPEDPTAASSAVAALLDMWPEMTFAERGRALRTVVSRVEVRAASRWREPERDRVTVHFRW